MNVKDLQKLLKRFEQQKKNIETLVYHFCLTLKVFGKEKYLNAAIKCGEVVWNCGILKKGYGICHGVAGNAYSFLSLYKQTKDAKYLHRAIKVRRILK